MKKQILNLGKALSKAEQRNVFGGANLSEAGSESTTCFCKNGAKVIGADCSWCRQYCQLRGGYKGFCIEWGSPQ